MSEQRRRVIFLNRFFYPDHAPTAELLSDVAFALAERELPSHERVRGVHKARQVSPSRSKRGLAASVDPTHPNHVEAKEWADDYDPQVIDELPIKCALGRIANRRNAARASPAKKKQGGSNT